MRRGFWRRYPRRKDGSREPGYVWVGESRSRIRYNEERRATIADDVAERHAEQETDGVADER